MAVDDGTAALRPLVDGLADGLTLVGNDEKLDRTPHHVDGLVDEDDEDEQENVAINDHFPIVKNQVTRCDDDQIADENDMSERDVVVLVDHRRYRIGASCTGIARQSEP